ncbi:unnamed protein product [Cutaneotrichosporon oleaginosum]
MLVALLFTLLLPLILLVRAAPQSPPALPSLPSPASLPPPRSTFLPEGPTTVVYTWTYPYTQTKTVVYGGPGWTTYLDYTTVDGVRVVHTVVAPTREAAASAVPEDGKDAGAGDDAEKGSCLWIVLVVAIVGMLLLGGLAAWLLLRRRKARRVEAVLVKKSPSIASSDAESTYSKDKEEA